MDLKNGGEDVLELNFIKCLFIFINTLSNWNAALVGIAASYICCFSMFVLFQKI